MHCQPTSLKGTGKDPSFISVLSSRADRKIAFCHFILISKEDPVVSAYVNKDHPIQEESKALWSSVNTELTKIEITKAVSFGIKHVVMIFFFIIALFIIYFQNFYWSTVDLQCCVSFRCTAK